MNLAYYSARDIGRLVTSKQISPVEVIEYFENRISDRNPSLNAFVYTKFDEAKEEARKLEKLIMKSSLNLPFAGVPIGLKDFLPSKKGWTNSHGGVKSLVRVDDADSVFYFAAREMGAIAIGKTNAPAFGFSGACDNKMYGPTRNPFNLKYNSGGSSGGTASAVADGLIPLGEGGDAGGSIRIPSAWCGCFGFKAGVGTVPNYCRPDGWTASHPFCCNGGITRTVEDSAYLLNYMTRYEARDPYSSPIHSDTDFVKCSKEPIDNLRVALTYDYNLFPDNKEVHAKLDETAFILESAGASVDLVSFNFAHTLDEFASMWCKTISIDTALDMKHWKEAGFDILKDHRDELPEEFIYWNDQASKMGIDDMYEFNKIRTDILDAFQNVFDRYDIILSPVTACMPVLNSDDGNTRQPSKLLGRDFNNVIGASETFLMNFIGYPAASVPSGLSSEGLPIGVQLVAPRYKEGDIFAVADKLESIRPWDYKQADTRM